MTEFCILEKPIFVWNALQPVDADHYVVRALAKTRLCHTFVSVNKPISYSSVRDYFKSSFKDIVLRSARIL